uniref:Uncharacterized protein n=1 Tax=Esox lucius TaxID=8010 RepID=A0AAY5K2A1_ESOLU
MPKGGGSKTPQLEDFPLNTDMVEKQSGKKDKDKVLSNKTPKLDRSDGVKEMKEKAPKRKLPFTVGANGDQKDSDSEMQSRGGGVVVFVLVMSAGFFATLLSSLEFSFVKICRKCFHCSFSSHIGIRTCPQSSLSHWLCAFFCAWTLMVEILEPVSRLLGEKFCLGVDGPWLPSCCLLNRPEVGLEPRLDGWQVTA